jgi:NADH:ubiquinone oxidoreductase subunit 6 (subunit J)
MVTLALSVAILICAIQSIRSRKLILSAIWLAGVSALLSIILFHMGAHQVAVIELSVGAGLVTVLLIFAIGVAGEEAINAPPIVPRALIFGLVILFIVLLGWYILPPSSTKPLQPEPPLTTVLWEERGLDVITQIILIFAGVLGLLGLLAEAKPPLDQPMADEFIAKRQEGLAELERESDYPALGRSVPKMEEAVFGDDKVKEVP